MCGCVFFAVHCITKSFKTSRLSWFGHVERMDGEEIIKRIMFVLFEVELLANEATRKHTSPI